MNRHKLIGILFTTMLASSFGYVASQGQQDEPAGQTATLPDPPEPAALSLPRLEPGQNSNLRFVPDAVGRTWRLSSSRGGRAQSEIQKAMSGLRAAESSEERSDAKASLKKALAAEYDKQMDSYDEHIESLEKELAEMRKRLEKRRDAKSDMVDLKMRQLLAESEGLGWPSSSKRSLFPGSGSPNFGSVNLTPNGPATTIFRSNSNIARPAAGFEKAASPAEPVRRTEKRQ